MQKFFLMAICAMLVNSAIADQPALQSHTTVITSPASDAGTGVDLRPKLIEVTTLIQTRQLDQAMKAARVIQAEFEHRFNKSKSQYAFASREERDEYRKIDASEFEWVDWGYSECLKLQAYIHAESNDFPSATAILRDAQRIAPTESGIAIELGFALAQSRQPEAALRSYTRALEISRKFASQRSAEPAALRGIGSTLVELGRLDEAEAALWDSQELDPESEVAKNELEYIRQLRAQP